MQPQRLRHRGPGRLHRGLAGVQGEVEDGQGRHHRVQLVRLLHHVRHAQHARRRVDGLRLAVGRHGEETLHAGAQPRLRRLEVVQACVDLALVQLPHQRLRVLRQQRRDQRLPRAVDALRKVLELLVERLERAHRREVQLVVAGVLRDVRQQLRLLRPRRRVLGGRLEKKHLAHEVRDQPAHGLRVERLPQHRPVQTVLEVRAHLRLHLLRHHLLQVRLQRVDGTLEPVHARRRPAQLLARHVPKGPLRRRLDPLHRDLARARLLSFLLGPRLGVLLQRLHLEDGVVRELRLQHRRLQALPRLRRERRTRRRRHGRARGRRSARRGAQREDGPRSGAAGRGPIGQRGGGRPRCVEVEVGRRGREHGGRRVLLRAASGGGRRRGRGSGGGGGGGGCGLLRDELGRQALLGVDLLQAASEGLRSLLPRQLFDALADADEGVVDAAHQLAVLLGAAAPLQRRLREDVAAAPLHLRVDVDVVLQKLPLVLPLPRLERRDVRLPVAREPAHQVLRPLLPQCRVLGQPLEECVQRLDQRHGVLLQGGLEGTHGARACALRHASHADEGRQEQAGVEGHLAGPGGAQDAACAQGRRRRLRRRGRRRTVLALRRGGAEGRRAVGGALGPEDGRVLVRHLLLLGHHLLEVLREELQEVARPRHRLPRRQLPLQHLERRVLDGLRVQLERRHDALRLRLRLLRAPRAHLTRLVDAVGVLLQRLALRRQTLLAPLRRLPQLLRRAAQGVRLVPRLHHVLHTLVVLRHLTDAPPRHLLPTLVRERLPRLELRGAEPARTRRRRGRHLRVVRRDAGEERGAQLVAAVLRAALAVFYLLGDAVGVLAPLDAALNVAGLPAAGAFSFDDREHGRLRKAVHFRLRVCVCACVCACVFTHFVFNEVQIL
eukprot:Rhum_TRINITY_DN14516_c15_g1::Rhum_TRINITY_DN14516_c15_g1_i1::g.94556::m.94556